MVTFMETLGKYHGGKVILEFPAKGESQSNGVAEGAVRIVRDFARVLKDQSEHHTKVQIEA